MLRLLLWLHRGWTKNDGRPWQDWAPGRDLKETALVSFLMLITVVMAGITIWPWLR
mgnify:CR=1 FL=1